MAPEREAGTLIFPGIRGRFADNSFDSLTNLATFIKACGMAGLQSRRAGKPARSSKSEAGRGSRSEKLGKNETARAVARSSADERPGKAVTAKPDKDSRGIEQKPSKLKRAIGVEVELVASKELSGKVQERKSDLTETDLRREVIGMPRPTMNLTHPERVSDLVYLACFRGRKFGRARFARLIHERIGSSEATERFVANVPVELVALFFAREVRPVSDDRAPVNECFELPDGGLLEFVGDHMEAAETVARLLLIHDEPRLDHVVELLTEHDRSWLHTLALEARDARLMELGFPDLDDVDRLFAPWHAQLLIRKLQAWADASLVPRHRLARSKITAEAVLAFAHDLTEPERQIALERLHFLALCQAVHDTRRAIRRMSQDSLNQSAAVALRILARGLREAGGDMTLLAGPQMATVYRLGLATLG